MPSRKHLHRTSLISSLILSLATPLLLAGPLAAEPVLRLSNGSTPVARLQIGDDLVVGLKGAAPFTSYTFTLRDSSGFEIATATTTTDAAGATEPTWLWERSGVAPCRTCRIVDPATYRFASLADAEAALHGHFLKVDARSTENGLLLVEASLEARRVPIERARFSDADGCERLAFEAGETVYLTLHHPDLSRPERRFFLLPGSFEAKLGATLTDVRGSAQTLYLDPTSSGPITLPLSIPADLPIGNYQGVLKAASGGASDDPIGSQILDLFDLLFANPGPPSTDGGLGLTVDILCPPPG